VAVKTVKEGASSQEKEDLLRELEIMQQLGSHTNVVTLLGCCTEKGKNLTLQSRNNYDCSQATLVHSGTLVTLEFEVSHWSLL
jgi:serine/threonine protein kinase